VCAADASWLVTDLVLAIQIARSGVNITDAFAQELAELIQSKVWQSPDPASCHGVLLGWLRKHGEPTGSTSQDLAGFSMGYGTFPFQVHLP